MKDTISEAASQALRTGTITDGLFTLNCGQLNKNTYDEVAEVLSRLGGKWNRSKGGHVFADKFPRQDFAVFLATGDMPPKNPMAYFPTPADLAEELADEIDDLFGFHSAASLIADHASGRADPGTRRIPKILEPSAGRGGLIDPILERVPELREHITAIESDQKHVPFLRERGVNVVHGDFLTWKTSETFDVIVMNPPFQGNTYKKHLKRAFDLLTDDGVLVAIVPAGVRQEPEFHRWLCRYFTVGDLGSGRFKACGTNVGTCIISGRKNDCDWKRKPKDNWPSWDAMHAHMLLSQETWFHATMKPLADDVAAGKVTLRDSLRPIEEAIERVARDALKHDTALCLDPNDVNALLCQYLTDLWEWNSGAEFSDEDARVAVMSRNPGQLEMVV